MSLEKKVGISGCKQSLSFPRCLGLIGLSRSMAVDTPRLGYLQQ
jgi:hypothetical protein